MKGNHGHWAGSPTKRLQGATNTQIEEKHARGTTESQNKEVRPALWEPEKKRRESGAAGG